MKNYINPKPPKNMVWGIPYYYIESGTGTRHIVIPEKPCDFSEGAVWLKGGTWIERTRIFEFTTPKEKEEIKTKNGEKLIITLKKRK